MPLHLILLVFALVLAVVAAFYQPTWPAHPGWLAVAFLAASLLVP
jgi:hypothetical protein